MRETVIYSVQSVLGDHMLHKAVISRVFFWPVAGSGTSCKHNADILSPYKVDMANVLAIYTSSRYGATLAVVFFRQCK